MFHLMFVHYNFNSVLFLSGHLLGNSCLLGWPFVLIVFCLFVIFIYFGFKSGIWLLIAPVPTRCFSITFTVLEFKTYG